MKVCTKCRITKPETDFPEVTKRGKRVIRARCIQCDRDYSKAFMRTKRAADHSFKTRQEEAGRKHRSSAEYKARRRVLARARYAIDPVFVARQKAASRRHYDHNPAVYQVIRQRRRARLIGAAGHFTREQLEARLAFYGYLCAYCGGPFEHVDHVIPLSRGGTNWPANLRPSCAFCNLSKHVRKQPYEKQYLAR